MDPRALRRTFLWVFVGFLAVTALLAIAAVLSGDFGDFEARVLGSSGSISAASICAMACAAFRERGRVPQLGTLGIALSGLALAVVLVTIWIHRPDDGLVKTALVLVVWAVATAHGELLLLPALARHGWAQVAAVAAIAVLALLLTFSIIGENIDEGMVRLIGVMAIVVALFTLVVPILWKIGGTAPAGAATAARDAATTPGAGTLVLRQAADGFWVDPAGARYAVQRLDGGPVTAASS